MGWHNPPMKWSELERTLSGSRPGQREPGRTGSEAGSGRRDPGHTIPDGGDAPGWSRKRLPCAAPRLSRPDDAVPYAELHCHSHFSFLDGASSPESLVTEAIRLGLSGLALTDHDGLYGAVRLAEAAEAYDFPTVFGAELSLDLPAPQNGEADPLGEHLLVLARGPEGYHRLAAALTAAHLRGGEKGRPVYRRAELAAQLRGHTVVLTGCRKSAVRRALTGPDGHGLDVQAAERALRELRDAYADVFVEVFHRGLPLDDAHNDALAEVAARVGVPIVATGNVHAATPADARLAAAMAAVRARRSLDELDGWLPPAGPPILRSGAEMTALFGHLPGAIERTVEIAQELAFPLRKASPRLPKPEVPAGHTPMTWLRELVRRGAESLYAGAPDSTFQRLEKELAVIEDKDFPGYFLVVHDIVAYARSQGILCQGRGSAANSAVCYALGITAVDSVKYDLPFERFLSATRDEAPDIDVDFDSDRREKVIQWVYGKYGRLNAAQVANVITYRPRSAIRDMAKALGYSTGQQDAWSKQMHVWGRVVDNPDHDIPQPVVDLAARLEKAPRHLGIHSGGMVLTERPIGEVCPIEPARMANRTVLQWDKDDCAWMGLVKFDLLGLGMLGCLQHTFDLVDRHLGETWTLASLPKEEPGVYDMLCRADTLGVFQVESRAQIGTLPRLRPRCFYDLVIEIALIRPGPIQGGAVHPYIRRRTGDEPVTYLHPKLEPVLRRTLGVPLFQEQLMQMAVAVGECDAAEADLLRRAMGSKRGVERIESLRAKLFAGMAANGITGTLADEIYARIEAFANFGFAESHAISFALLVYASSWLKLHYPAAFLAGLLRNQPMGFYSPRSLVEDGKRHGVEVRRPDINLSAAQSDLEPVSVADEAREAGEAGEAGEVRQQPTGMDSCVATEQPPVGEFVRPRDPAAGLAATLAHRRDGLLAVRLGLSEVTGLEMALAERIVAERAAGGQFASLTDLTRRVRLTAPQVEALATAGAFDGFGLTRRQALWGAGQAAMFAPGQLELPLGDETAPELPEMTPEESTVADLWATGMSPERHPMEHVREELVARRILSVADVMAAEARDRVLVGGLVTHRQRPATASGVTFLNLEDETGMLNVVCSVGVMSRYPKVGRSATAMIIRGTVERQDGVVNLVADRLEALPLRTRTTSRDFR
ncbi:error-prone DNA polymerase [Granulicoccus sp. GXG6511]|uniref:error-prone DNA polymerase n=1 Tax=Granulicoccus sp. GXG6511 TaxID=3381351 RepID=UPI003D7C5C82